MPTTSGSPAAPTRWPRATGACRSSSSHGKRLAGQRGQDRGPVGDGGRGLSWCRLRRRAGLLEQAGARLGTDRLLGGASGATGSSRLIGALQAVAQRLADACIDAEAIRLTLWQAAWPLERGLPAEAGGAAAKSWAAAAGHRIAHTAVHVHAGVGIDLSHPLHRYYTYYTAAKRGDFAPGGATARLRRLGAIPACQER